MLQGTLADVLPEVKQMPREGKRVLEEEAVGIAPGEFDLLRGKATTYGLGQTVFQAGEVPGEALRVVGEALPAIMRLPGGQDGYAVHGHLQAGCRRVDQAEMGVLDQVIGVDLGIRRGEEAVRRRIRQRVAGDPPRRPAA